MPAPDHRASRTYFELIEALPQPGCAVCRIVDTALQGYIDMFIYENVNNLARRQEIRESRGFCSVHAGVMASAYGRKQSIAILQQDILHDVLAEIDQARSGRGTTGLIGRVRRGVSSIQRIRAATRPRQECPLCQYEWIQEIAILRTLADDALDPDLRPALGRSAGLCLPHFHMLLGLEHVRPAHLEVLLDVEQRALTAAKQQLDEYVHHQNASYDGEATLEGEAAEAPVRGAQLTSGRIHHADARRRHPTPPGRHTARA